MSVALQKQFGIVALGLASVLMATSAFAAVGRTPIDYGVSSNGQATYRVPIVAPTGTGGLAPQLALVYGHRNSNTLLGAGWGVAGLSSIDRCGHTVAQDGATYGIALSNGDRFCLDGNQLKLTGGAFYGADASEYATESESFSRIRAYTSGRTGFLPSVGPQWFEVYGKDGLIYEYGSTEDSRVAVLSTAIPRAWALQKIRDRTGNEITFTYTKDLTNGSYRIVQVNWTANPSLAVASSHQILFVYQTKPAGEIDAGFYEGSALKEINRLDRIDVSYQGTLMRRYELNYEASLSSTGKSRLASISECVGATGTDCLPNTAFTYINGTSGITTESASTNTVTTASSALPIDVNGDGRTDLVYSSSTVSGSGTWMVAFANTAGGYNAAVNTTITNTNFTQAIPIDYNGDGLQDVLVPYSGGTWWVLQGTTSGLAAPVNTSAPASGAGGNAITLDVNGDGLDDLVWLNPNDPVSVEWRARIPGAAFAASAASWLDSIDGTIAASTLASNWLPRGDRRPDFDGDGRADALVSLLVPASSTYYTVTLLGGGGLSGSSLSPVANLRYLDLNRDGYTDVAYTSGSNWCFRINNGLTFGAETVGPAIGSQTVAQAVVMDWDGDGYDDLVVPSGTTWWYMRSTGETLSAAVNSSQTAAASTAFAGDANGDGLDDLIYVKSTNILAYRPHAGVLADRLNIATDGYGNTVDFDYVTLAQNNYTKYASWAFPYQDYQGALDVVSLYRASTLVDASTYTISYWYYGAILHRQGRGFLGFNARRVNDSRTGGYAFDYHYPVFPYADITIQHDDLQPDAATRFGQVVNSLSGLTLGAGWETRFYPYVSQSTVKSWEQGGAYNGNQISQAVTTVLVDSYGTAYDVTTTTTEQATANGVQSGATYTRRTLHPLLNLVNDTTNWCLGRPEQTQQINSHSQYGGTQTTRTVNRTWNYPLCRLTQEISEPGNSTLQATRDVGYDGFGNVTSETVTGKNPDGSTMTARAASVLYDASGRLQTSISNALSQATTLTYSVGVTVQRGLGLPDFQTDPNGLQTTWTYDDFGRKTRETRTDSTYTTWSYANCSPNCVNTNNKLLVTATDFNSAGTALADHLSYLDKADRALVNKDKLLAGTYNRIDRQFDSRGNLYRQSEPCAWSAVTTTCTNWNTFTYDLLNRPTLVQRAVSSSDPTLQSVTTYYEGLKTRVVDPMTKTTATVRTVVGQLARTIDAASYYQNFDYDAFGNPIRVVDSLGTTQQSNTFNLRGQKTASTDLNMGSWTFEFNSLGELLRVRDAKTSAPNWTTQMTYDALGRMTTRQDVPESVTSTWTWGTSAASKNIGRLASLTTSNSSYSESLTYDSLARPSVRTITTDAAYSFDYTYNNEGTLSTLTYPTSTNSCRIKLLYGYQNGQLRTITDNSNTLQCGATGTVYWTANATNVRGQLTQETFGNSLITNRAFDAVNGYMATLQTGPSGTPTSVQNLSYLWDKSGNVTQRQDVRQSLTESFYYDDLYRLEHSTLKVGTGTPSTNLTMVYDSTGNITSKSDVGTFTYDPTRKQQVTSTSNGWLFTYDANGNMSTRRVGTNTITWFSYNLPNAVTHGGAVNTFLYNPNRDRYRLDYTNAGITETTMYVGGLLEKWTKTGATTEYRHYIQAGGRAIALLTRQLSNPTVSLVRYFHLDHLNSIETVSNSNQSIYVREGFDAYGVRRDPTTWSGGIPAADATLVGNLSRRGYTFHESLGSATLNHMNGRVQDPSLGRFISADPNIDGLSDTQGWNRYSYVQGNPVSKTDPTGFEANEDRGEQDRLSIATTLAEAAAERVWQQTHEWLNSRIMAVPNIVGYTIGANPGVIYDSYASARRAGDHALTQTLLAYAGGWQGEAGRSVLVDRANSVFAGGFDLSTGLPLMAMNSPQGNRLPQDLGSYLDKAADGDWWGAMKAGFIMIKNSWKAAYSTKESALLTTMSMIPIVGVEAKIARAEYNLTRTVQNNLATRPYYNSPLTIGEIRATGAGVRDPGGIPGALRYDVPGSFNGSQGTYELVLHPETNTIYHFVFISK